MYSFIFLVLECFLYLVGTGEQLLLLPCLKECRYRLRICGRNGPGELYPLSNVAASFVFYQLGATSTFAILRKIPSFYRLCPPMTAMAKQSPLTQNAKCFFILCPLGNLYVHEFPQDRCRSVISSTLLKLYLPIMVWAVQT